MDSYHPIIMQPGDVIKPSIDEEAACRIVISVYGLQISNIKELNAYDDKNFHIIAHRSENEYINPVLTEGYVFKVLNTIDSRNAQFIDAQNKVLLYLREKKIPVPVPVKTLHGDYYSLQTIHAKDKTERTHIVRLLEFKPGTIFKSVSTAHYLYYEAGVWLANLNNALKDFYHPVFDKHTTIWHVKSVPLLKRYLDVVKDGDRRAMVSEIIEAFIQRIVANYNQLQHGIIHGDFNEQNILVKGGENEEYTISAILDFGDINYSCYLFEIGTALCYMMLEARRVGLDPIKCGSETLKGYQSVRRLTSFEASLLRLTICSRLSQSLVLGMATQSLQPDNAYVGDTQPNGWALLYDIWNKYDDEMLSSTHEI